MEINDIQFYRQRLLTDQKVTSRLLSQLARMDHERFLSICNGLLREAPEITVRRVVFSLLGQYGLEDTFAEDKALEALNVPELVNAALLALGRVGASKSYPVLFTYAQQGVADAMRSLNRLPLPDVDKQRLVLLARSFVFSTNYDIVDISLEVLLRHSSIVIEEQLLLQAAQKYYNEGVLGILGRYATPAVIPDLRAMLSRIPEDSVEFADTSHALDEITRRFNTERA